MTIDEAIQQARYVADEHSDCWRNCENIEKCCKECEYEHEQLAEWLEELKSYKRNTDICPICDTYCSYLSEEFENGYNKAIDDFAKLVEIWCWKHEQYNQDDLNKLMNIAEQLKAGGKNE